MPISNYKSRPTQRIACQRWDYIARLVKPGKLLQLQHITRLDKGVFTHVWRAEYTKHTEFRSDDLPPSQ